VQTGRIAEVVQEIGLHQNKYSRVKRSGGGMIEINARSQFSSPCGLRWALRAKKKPHPGLGDEAQNQH
jgi:hypothetical protein